MAVAWIRLMYAPVGFLILIQFHQPPLTPEPVYGCVRRHPLQPGTQRPVRRHPAQELQQLQEGVLGDVLGHGPVANQAQCQRMDRPRVA